MENKNIFEPRTELYTEKYDSNKELIAMLDGHIKIDPIDYDDFMPIVYRHITTTTQINNEVKIEKEVIYNETKNEKQNTK